MKFHLPSLFCSLVFIACALTSGCNTDDLNPLNYNDDGPDVPASDTMVMDTESFTAASEVAASVGGFSTTEVTLSSTSNHNFAAFNVGVWNTVIAVGLAVPVAAFLESFHHRPFRTIDNRWLRTYTVRLGGNIYSAKLYANVLDYEVQWEMVVSRFGHYENFTWFTGVSRRDGTSGYWILNKNPNNPVNLLRIDWHKDFTTHTGDIQYSNIEPGAVENGGYIFYGTDVDASSDLPYDAFYDIYIKGQDDLIEIEWNRASKNGRVRNLQHFGNEDWHYWNSAFQDIDLLA